MQEGTNVVKCTNHVYQAFGCILGALSKISMRMCHLIPELKQPLEKG
jgi:hypothetical protein